MKLVKWETIKHRVTSDPFYFTYPEWDDCKVWYVRGMFNIEDDAEVIVFSEAVSPKLEDGMSFREAHEAE